MAGLSPVAATWLPTEQGDGLPRLSLSHLDHCSGLGLLPVLPGFPPKARGVRCWLVTLEVKWGEWVGTGCSRQHDDTVRCGSRGPEVGGRRSGSCGVRELASPRPPSSTSTHHFLPPSPPWSPSSFPAPPSHPSHHHLLGHRHLHQVRRLLPIHTIPATTLLLPLAPCGTYFNSEIPTPAYKVGILTMTMIYEA